MSSRRDAIKVFLRVCPERDARLAATGPKFSVDHSFENSHIRLQVDRHGEGDVVNHSVEEYNFRFDRVFEPKATQEDIFNMVARDCTMSALDGYNSTIFAYGQTGSGKTYTITGGADSYEDRGIIPRCLSFMFDEVSKRTEFEWTVRVSYLQIYNEKGQDLINGQKDAKSLEDMRPVHVTEADDEVYLKGLESHTTRSLREALDLLFLGDTNRLTCETPMNSSSTRSHCIFTVSLEARAKGSAIVRRSKLNLVDLAGSERVSRTGVVGNLLTEAKYINLSLHHLEHVIVALSEQAHGRREHVPFRNSLMTMVLKDSLGGNCRTAMIATCYPSQKYFMETISTCKFAQRVGLIRQNAHVNEETDPTVLVRKLKVEVAQLKEQLAFHTKGDQDPDRVLSSDEMERCREVVSKYIAEPDPKVQISGLGGDLARIFSCFAIFKGLVQGKPLLWLTSQESSTNRPGTKGGGGGDGGEKLQTQIGALQASLQQKENELTLLLGMVEQHNVPKLNAQTQTVDDPGRLTSSFGGLGLLPPLTRPTVATLGSSGGVLKEPSPPSLLQQPLRPPTNAHVLPPSLDDEKAAATQEFLRRQSLLREQYDLTSLTDSDMLKDRAAAFEAFRRSYRKYEQIEKNKADLKLKYDTCKQLAEEINIRVDAIKKLKGTIQRFRAERALQGTDEAYPEETAAVNDLSSRKQEYHDLAKSLAKEKEWVDNMHLVMNRSRDQLTKDFEEWFSLRQKQVSQCQQPIPPPPPSGLTGVLDGLARSKGTATTPPPLPGVLPPVGGPSMLSSSVVGLLSSQRTNSAPSSLAPPPEPTLVKRSSDFLSGASSVRDALPTTTTVLDKPVVNPFFPSQPSTGMAAADEQLAMLHKAREEMRARMVGK